MKKIRVIIMTVIAVTLLLSFTALAADYSVYWSNMTNYFHGTATPFTDTPTGQYGRLIWKQDFEGKTIGDY